MKTTTPSQQQEEDRIKSIFEENSYREMLRNQITSINNVQDKI